MPRGRKAGFKMPDEYRSKIAKSQVLNALIEHTEGRREMSSTQVTAGIALLRKVLPDLAATDVTSNGESVQFPAQIVISAANERANGDD